MSSTLEICNGLLDDLIKIDKKLKNLDKIKNENKNEHQNASKNENDMDEHLCLDCSNGTNKYSKMNLDTLKIDIHNHILPEVIPDFKKEFGYGGFIRLDKIENKPGWAQMWKDDKFFREIDEKCWSVDARLEDMNKNNVQVQILSTVPVMFSYWAKPRDTLRVSQFLNNDIYNKCKKYPHRFVGLGTLPMNDISLAVLELRRCMKELNFVGIEIASHIGKYNLDDKRFFPLWKEAEKLNACIFVHPWDMMGQPQMQKYWLPWLVSMPAESSRAICSLMFGGVFKKYPKLRFCFAHGGGSFPHTVGRIQHGYDCRPDLIQVNCIGKKDEPYSWLGHFWCDTLVHNHDAFDYLIKTIGQNRIILGTDYPFPLGECYPLKNCGELVETHKKLNKKDKKQILWYNGLEFINRKSSDFTKDDTKLNI